MVLDLGCISSDLLLPTSTQVLLQLRRLRATSRLDLEERPRHAYRAGLWGMVHRWFVKDTWEPHYFGRQTTYKL